MPEPISGTWIKVGGLLIIGLLVICSTLLGFLWQGQVEAIEKMDAAIELVEGRVTAIEINLKGSTTNIEHIQTDIREIKYAVQKLGDRP